MNLKTIFISIMLTMSASTALADAPIVDLSQTNSAVPSSNVTSNSQAAVATGVPNDAAQVSQQPLSMDQRVAKLENQMNNMANMNLATQVDQLQQQIQQLQGQLQVAQHDLKTLDEQQRNFYQDLDQRLNNLKALINNTPVTNATTSSTLDSLNQGANSTLTATAPVTSAAISSITSGAIPGDQQQAYNAAFTKLKNKDYRQAATAFQNFLADYPDSKLVSNVHYWLGEIYYQQGDNEKAGQAFQTVIKQYSKSQKVPDAMLKFAYVLRDNKKYSQALAELNALRSKYPSSAAARLAKMQIDAIHKQMQTTTVTNDVQSSSQLAD